eukprot:8140658-Pyramimonas_sp.AAC.1
MELALSLLAPSAHGSPLGSPLLSALPPMPAPREPPLPRFSSAKASSEAMAMVTSAMVDAGLARMRDSSTSSSMEAMVLGFGVPQ